MPGADRVKVSLQARGTSGRVWFDDVFAGVAGGRNLLANAGMDVPAVRTYPHEQRFGLCRSWRSRFPRDKVVFAVDEAMKRSGKGAQRILIGSCPLIRGTCPLWSPTGDEIAFFALKRFVRGALPMSSGLAFVSPAGGKPTFARTDAVSANEGTLAYSPDGKRLAAVMLPRVGKRKWAGSRLFIVDRPSGKTRLVTKDIFVDQGEPPAWTATGKFLYFAGTHAKTPPIMHTQVTTVRRYSAPARGKWAKEAGTWKPSVRVKRGPTGPWMCDQIWQYSVASNRVVEVTRLTAASCDAPSVNPIDGRVAYVSTREWPNGPYDFKCDIMLGNGDGGSPTPLTSGGMFCGPRWSPNGERLAFTFRRFSHEIWTMTQAGGDWCRAYGGPVHMASPRDFAWHPDGRHLVFVGNRDGDFYAVGWEGRCVHRLTFGAFVESQFSLSSDGRFAVYHRSNGCESEDFRESYICIQPLPELTH